MALSWNEIRSRALAFAREWESETREEAEAKTFWDQFFDVFGINRRRLAQFEVAVKKINGKHGYIDLLWPGMLLVEHKSRGKNLDSAYGQSMDYFQGLTDKELPRYVLVSDFAQFRLYDLDEKTDVAFTLAELPQQVHLLGFIAGYQKRVYRDQDPVNIAAAERLGKLHDYLEAQKYSGHPLEVFMVRVLFCLFAEDTGIFKRYQFEDYIKDHTAEDGSDVGSKLNELFIILDKADDARQTNLDDDLLAFPYVNGKLYEERIDPPYFDKKGREALLYCADFDWSKISPAIFGSLFQSVMNPVERRNLGAHYTSEKNIMKVISSLFLDELHAEFHKVKGSPKQLEQFHEKLARLKFLDPACGSGNFLIMAYRELRRLELEVLKVKFKFVDNRKAFLMNVDIKLISKLYVSQFYGIEIDEFAARVAEVALYLIDHQMNTELSVVFGEYFARLPLKESPHIVHGNALRIKWEDVVPPSELSYILGNPPFVGKHLMDKNQQADIKLVTSGIKGGGELDMVCGWFIKASEYIKETSIQVAFVSTNSISQGEQVGILWNKLLKGDISIKFAHRTFRWTNEAKGKAAVYVVIIGFARSGVLSGSEKNIYIYDNIKSEPISLPARNINPYLIDFDDLLILSRRKPISLVPALQYGNKPADGGHLILTNQEKKEFLIQDPSTKKYIREMVSAKEYLRGTKRWCLWLVDADPKEIRNIPLVLERVKAVKEFRLKSIKAATVKLAATPTLFAEIRQPKKPYVIIPRVTSEFRDYIPFSFLNPSVIVNDSCTCLPEGTLFHLGVMSSAMHMAWVKQVCGRLKGDFRYSNDIVYNNYPWPAQPTSAQVAKIESCAQAVLDARAAHPTATLADLYDPLTMPPDLLKAHHKLDEAVDRAYRPQPFANELGRLQYLFELYRQYTQPLLKDEKPKKARRKTVK